MLTPIDYRKVPVALETASGIIHRPTNFPTKESWPADGLTICQQWQPVLYNVENADGYLSVVTYIPTATECTQRWSRGVIGSIVEKYGEYKTALTTNPDGYFLVPYCARRAWGGGRNQNGVEWFYGNSSSEIRIYNNDKIAVVFTANFPDGSTIKYMTNKTQDNSMTNMGLPWAVENGHPRIDCMLEKFPGILIVSSDEQIANQAVKATYKAVPALLGLVPRNAQDLRRKYICYANSYATTQMAAETIAEFKTFLRCDDPANDDRRAAWQRKCHLSSVAPKYFEEVLMWLATPSQKKNVTVTKEALAQAYLESVPELKKLWEQPSAENTMYWARSANAILAMGTHCSKYYDVKRLFAFDLKRKTRFYGEFGNHICRWTFPIPSAKQLADGFTSYATATILGNLTPAQLFAGTNAGWLLENTKGVSIPDPFYRYTPGGQQGLVSLQDVITSRRQSHWAMTALATSGEALFEQLLKSGLVKLYSAALSATARGELSELFQKPSCREIWRCTAWSYNPKGKNLPQMLGAPMGLIRKAEEYTEYQLTSGYSDTAYELALPKVRELLKAMPTLGAADVATQEFWLQRSRSFRSYSVSRELRMLQEVQERIGETSPAKLAQLTTKYGESLQWLPDYHKAQELLQKIQQNHPELPGLYNSRLYPNMPGKAVRFIHFIPGTQIRVSWVYPSRTTELLPEKFLEMQHDRFPDATIVPAYDDLGKLLGAQVTMTPGDNLRYLHDDANYWVGFYGQADKREAFQQAVRRVAGLAWTDPKLGLTIRAPQSVEELNQEGAVLMHSVASFADAIIAGSTNVMFIRRVDMPDMPYFTLELRPNGAIRQVHCLLNGGTSEAEQAKAFAASGLVCYQSFRDILRFLVNWGRAFPHNIDLLTLKREYQSYLA